MVRDALGAEEATTVPRDQDIILDTDATEVLIRFQLLEVQELLAMTAGLPVVDKSRYEVDTRFVGHHKTLLQSSTHAQTIGAELLQIRACLLIEAHIDLSEALHVVNIHTHHVSQSVRQEHGVGTGSDSLVHIALQTDKRSLPVIT